MEQNILTTFLLPASLFIIMLGLGLALQTDDFKRIIKYPRAIFIGIANQMILLPLIGFTIASVLNLEPELAVGIMILAACPGGVTSNLISYLANGDTALSVTLTAISSIISIITIPLVINFSLSQFMHEGQELQLPVVKTIAQIMAITIVPIILGMLVRLKRPAIAFKLEKSVKIASAVILFVIIFGIIWKERDRMPGFFEQVGIAVGLLNIITMLVGFYTAKLAKLGLPQTIAIALESGLQNGTLGIVIAISLLLNAEMSIPSAVYGLFMFATGGFMIWRFGRTKEGTAN
jgi:BASS family bile acid:Na+ symporter